MSVKALDNRAWSMISQNVVVPQILAHIQCLTDCSVNIVSVKIIKIVKKNKKSVW